MMPVSWGIRIIPGSVLLIGQAWRLKCKGWGHESHWGTAMIRMNALMVPTGMCHYVNIELKPAGVQRKQPNIYIDNLVKPKVNSRQPY